jgi:hypothetical protein
MLGKSKVVTVYKDPETKKEPEGDAVLLRPVREEGICEIWMVIFVGTDLVAERRIHKECIATALF